NGRNSTGHGPRVHELRTEYEKAFANYTADELVATIRKYTGNAAAYQRLDATMQHPQTEALGIVRTVSSVDGAQIRVRAFPAPFPRLRPQLNGMAPGLGEHTAEIASALGFTQEEVAAMRRQAAASIPAA